jgi:hypothetical protein
VCDDQGERLAKRHDALSLRILRGRGALPADLRADWRPLVRLAPVDSLKKDTEGI